MAGREDAENGLGEDRREPERIEKREMESREDSIEEKQRRHRRLSRSSRASNASDDTDPLSPLELAISPGIQVFEEVVRVRTATSVGTSASRLPDYEVAFEENDPENPRHWPLWYRSVCNIDNRFPPLACLGEIVFSHQADEGVTTLKPFLTPYSKVTC